MIQLVIKNGAVQAWHDLAQDLDGKYPGAEVVLYDGPAPRRSNTLFAPDPRLWRDPLVRLRRPSSCVIIYDDEGIRHSLAIAPESLLKVKKEV